MSTPTNVDVTKVGVDNRGNIVEFLAIAEHPPDGAARATAACEQTLAHVGGYGDDDAWMGDGQWRLEATCTAYDFPDGMLCVTASDVRQAIQSLAWLPDSSHWKGKPCTWLYQSNHLRTGAHRPFLPSS